MNKKVKKEKSKKGSQVKVETTHPVRSKSRIKYGTNGTHTNIRCKNCLIVDGYLEGEKVCRYCGAGFLLNRG